MLRPEIAKLRRYVPGKPIAEVQDEYNLKVVHKLASNENPLGPSPLAQAAARDWLGHVELYPDASSAQLREGLAVHWQIDSSQIVVGDGSDELLRILASMFIQPGDEAVMADLTFGVYSHAVTVMGGTPIRIPLRDYTHDLKAMAAMCTTRTKMVFICNPNNPTGTYVTANDLEEFMVTIPKNVVVVFDEAYFEFVSEVHPADGLNILRRGFPVVVLRTFSKAYGLAGLRVGYGMTTPEFAAALNTVRAPFNVNSLAQVAALAALDDREHLKNTLENNALGRNWLTEQLTLLGCTVVPSQANFVLVDVHLDSRELYPRLLRHGVIVRPGYEFGLSTYLRISIGTPAQLQACVQALTEELTTL